MLNYVCSKSFSEESGSSLVLHLYVVSLDLPLPFKVGVDRFLLYTCTSFIILQRVCGLMRELCPVLIGRW